MSAKNLNKPNTIEENQKDSRMIEHFMVLAADINDIRVYGGSVDSKETKIGTARRTMYELTPTGRQTALALHEMEFGITWFAVCEGK
jgi:hypothetical protein